MTKILIAYALSLSLALATDVRATVPASQPRVVQASTPVNFNLDVWGCDRVTADVNGGGAVTKLYPYSISFTAVPDGTNTIVITYCDVLGRSGTNSVNILSASVNAIIHLRRLKRQ